jgi:hypothetical protein
MEAKDKGPLSFETGVATAVVTGLERLITVLTHPNYLAMASRMGPVLSEAERAAQSRTALAGQAWLLETAIARARREARGG